MDEINLKLINLIKSAPCIYDKTNIYYSNKDYTKLIWSEISNELQLSVPICQKRWRYLRDYFVRQLRIYNDENTKSTWQFFDAMSFIIPFSTTRKRPYNNSINKISQDKNKINRFHINQSIQNESKFFIGENLYNNENELNIYECLNQKDINVVNTNKISNLNSVPVSQTNHYSSVLLNGNHSSQINYDAYQNIAIKTESINTDSMSTQEECYLNNNKKIKLSDNSNFSSINELHGFKTNNSNDNDDEHIYFFKSILSNVRNIDKKYIIQFRTEMLQLISKYLTKHEKKSFNKNITKEVNGQLENLIIDSRPDSSLSDIVIVETDKFNWRDKLN